MNIKWIVLLCILFNDNKCEPNHNLQCCKHGEKLALQSFERTLLKAEPDLNRCSISYFKEYVANQQKELLKSRICSLIGRSCCLKAFKTELCQIAAKEDVDCEFIVEEKSAIIDQIKLECCLCCQKENPMPMNTFNNCNLLNGRCPKKSITTTSTIPSTISYTENITDWSMKTTDSNSTYSFTENNFTHNLSTVEPLLEDSSNSTKNASNTIESVPDTYSIKWTSRQPPETTSIITYLSTTTTTKSIICEERYIWDSVKQVCIHMIISCPKKFVLNPETQRCVPVILPKTSCSKGFYYNQFKNKCLDIDECKTGVKCENNVQICINLIGSYKCECIKGLKKNKTGSCEDIDECANPNICAEDKKCKNLIGSYRCIRAIPCGFGWKEDIETNECVDVDECEAFPDICGVGMKCVNIRGSHKCEDEECPKNMRRNNRGKCARCRDGFKMNNVTNECEDIDECTEKAHLYKGRCKDSENCVNLPGTYECAPKKKCRPGTLLTKNGTMCEDVDECKEMKFRCSSDDICINTYSSYQCVASPCAPSQNFDYVTQKCLCKDGYRSSGENYCEDIDECTEIGTNGPCGSMFICVNKPGSYVCINRIDCAKGMYRPSMDSICQDIDECETGEGKCPLNMHCVNMVGSYRCMCDRGFILLNNGSCADINECLLFRPEESCPDLEARCVNTPGSYKCQCSKGFEWSDYPLKKCTDIDECKDIINPCGGQHLCFNIIGSYKCQCDTGYTPSIRGDKCEDIDECLMIPKKCTNGRCINIPGRYNCQCPKGFLPDNNEVCQDIDECTNFKGICQETLNNFESPRRCINLLGYYKCVNNSCPQEYSQIPLGNGFTCILNQESHCELNNIDCLNSRPYRKTVEFIELSPQMDLPRILTRINVGHLPPGNNRINLQIKYAHNTETKKPIGIRNSFQLTRGRNKNEDIDILLRHPITAPAEVLLYLQTSVYHGQQYFGYSEAFINLYFTKYPEL